MQVTMAKGLEVVVVVLALLTVGYGQTCSLSVAGSTKQYTGCMDVDSTMSFYYKMNGTDRINIAIRAAVDGYAGIGFGPTMVGSSAAIIYSGPNGGIEAGDFFFKSTAGSDILAQTKQGLEFIAVEYVGSTLVMEFSRPLAPPGLPPIVNGQNAMIWAHATSKVGDLNDWPAHMGSDRGEIQFTIDTSVPSTPTPAPVPSTSPPTSSPAPTSAETPEPSTVAPNPTSTTTGSPTPTSATSPVPSMENPPLPESPEPTQTGLPSTPTATPVDGASFSELPSAEADNDGVCFPADASVELENGQFVQMEHLNVGDRVRTASNTFSPVFFMTHKISPQADTKFSFVSITTASTTLELSRSHYLHINGKLSVASAAQVGDLVDVVSGTKNQMEAILAIETVSKAGLYNPHTIDGDIVVNSIKASCYTSTVSPRLAHALLFPVRLAFENFFPWESVFSRMLYAGNHALAAFTPRGPSVI